MATEDGGPIDIIRNCRNGHLVDPLDKEAMAETILRTLVDKKEWRSFAKNGLSGVRRHYSWQAHVEKYLGVVRPLVEKTSPLIRMAPIRRRSISRKQALFAELDLAARR